MSKGKSRTLSISDENWEMISSVCYDLGFTERTRAPAIVQVFKEKREQLDKAKK